MDGELMDWEILHGSDTESTGSVASEKKSGNSSVIDDGMFHSDHFSVDNLIERRGEITGRSQYDFVESGDSSRGDYGLEPPNRRENLSEVLVDLSSGQSDVNRLGDAGFGNELGFNDCPDEGSVSKTGISGDGEIRLGESEAADEKNVKSEAAAELADETLSNHEDASKCLLESGDREVVDEQSQAGVEEASETLGSYNDSSKSWSESAVVNGNDDTGLDSGVVSNEEIDGIGGNTVEREAEAVNSAVVSSDESKSKEIVWWKMPFVLVKYCAFKIGPVWSVSMAAALMGIVLLGRRLYNAKKKAQRFHLKVTVDDKKVSRVMSQAARLNEVFTEVRRVPVIRPALPSPGAWPVLTLR